MTPDVVVDASCLIDIRKGGLLAPFCSLPRSLVIPVPVRVLEVLDFSGRDWACLDGGGMITHDLTAKEATSADAVRQEQRGLSFTDCCCLSTAMSRQAILLTGDALLRRVATRHGLEVHGVLWVVDELAAARACPASLLESALRAWQRDSAVFLPPDEVARRLGSIRGKEILSVE